MQNSSDFIFYYLQNQILSIKPDSQLYGVILLLYLTCKLCEILSVICTCKLCEILSVICIYVTVIDYFICFNCSNDLQNHGQCILTVSSRSGSKAAPYFLLWYFNISIIKWIFLIKRRKLLWVQITSRMHLRWNCLSFTKFRQMFMVKLSMVCSSCLTRKIVLI